MRKHMTNKGFTLIEIIVSIAIIGIISILFVSVFAKSLEISIANTRMNKQSLLSTSAVTKGDINETGTVPALQFGAHTFNKSGTISKSGKGIYYIFRISDK